ncbi:MULTISPECIES: EscC/YscC/HrcC family type III secretion system outer membrane ring protein [Vibrio]|uniref:EscC/YscC/HrcC family type III secretion system outer membrane ring protein n=1 Tax=Vibrio TaxID=662 RepID=UPI0005FA9403|nr:MULTISPECIES: EscC/YscC/HrcC family type III secretion system outer membrane ring protein [Vibrio]KJY94151.1 outer membrane secretin SsaC [Vibrio neptunius]MDA0116461.1 EscC/YscC/HrcC family type III secretion system outer membrane ring protein [Vibrio sp. T11.5]
MKKLLCWLLLFTINFAHAAPISAVQWHGEPFVFYSRGTPLKSVIEDVGKNYGIPMEVSDQVKDTFSGQIEGQTPKQILKMLAQQYGLVWYYDGDLLHVNKAREVTNEVISLSSLSNQEATRYIAKAGFMDKVACEVTPISGLHAVQVNGVPACVSTVSKFVQQLDNDSKQHAQSQKSVKIFPLKYASATDTVYSYRSQDVTVPGVVSVLKQIEQDQGPDESNQTSTSFSADSRQNAVIIRTNKMDMAMYASLIKQLDITPTMIEVSVTIIDVDTSDFNQLGIDWSAAAKIGGGSITFNQGSLSSDNFSTVIGNTGNFMVRLNALEQNSKAKVLSRPSVVTLNNVQAVLDKNVTFYTKIEGEKVAKLESVTTGSLLRVTPRLVTENHYKKVMLSLNIQDGQQSKPVSSKDPLPQVENSEIATQATLKTGESLLLGGFVQEKDHTVENKIPLLGDIPLLGGLFRSTDHSKQSVMRLFLIKAEPVNQ